MNDTVKETWEELTKAVLEWGYDEEKFWEWYHDGGCCSELDNDPGVQWALGYLSGYADALNLTLVQLLDEIT